ncbi:membrane hypothetical protein [uncultured delta proteobacterium]|uniref:Uncharacterized protein n=1 Tax=uncultured delta proteobacterium TaxID=34034 RepID=A0A212JYQ6_9DELT|nr:membrane hypothetical protein [uncultured delta proteobacterium]
MLKIQYGVFLLLAAAIFIFTGPAGRRCFFLAVATGGSASFLIRFLYAGLGTAELTLLQALVFPFLVLGTWGALFLVSKLRGR